MGSTNALRDAEQATAASRSGDNLESADATNKENEDASCRAADDRFWFSHWPRERQAPNPGPPARFTGRFRIRPAGRRM